MFSLRTFRKCTLFRGQIVVTKLKTLQQFSSTKATPPSVTTAFPINNGKFIVLSAKDGAEKMDFKYPSIWLRDNCQCNQCFHAGSNSRTVDWTRFDVTVTPAFVEVIFII